MTPKRNPWVGINYLPDNPAVEVPPPFFLQRVFDFDADIVIVPSRQRPHAYVIARRRRISAGAENKPLEDSLRDSDTAMCLTHNLVPVCLMFKTGPLWDADRIIARLAARDLWAHGGGDAAADLLEAQEAEEKKRTQAAIRDDMYNRSGDAWRSYQYRTGQRVSMAGSRGTSGRPLSKRPPSGSTAGSGVALFVGDQAD